VEARDDSFDLSGILAAGPLEAAWPNIWVGRELLEAICLWSLWFKLVLKRAFSVCCTAKAVADSDSRSGWVAGLMPLFEQVDRARLCPHCPLGGS